MIELCRSCLHLFDGNWVSEITGRIVVTETNPDGAGEAVFRTDKPCVFVKAQDNSTILRALDQKKCADGAFFLFDSDKKQAHLHIIELKSNVRLADWAKVLHQFEGMYLTALAVARLLQVHEVACVTCYLAAKADLITNHESETASPTLLKTLVGKTRTVGGRESWEKGVIELPLSANELPLSVKAILVKGWKNGEGVVDFGVV